MTKQEILDRLSRMEEENAARTAALTDRCSLEDYRSLTVEKDGLLIWTAALQAALNEHEIVEIPVSEEIYWIDNTVVIPSNRAIFAHGAVIRLTSDTTVLMLRNEHTLDGTHRPISREDSDANIAIFGGFWEESSTGRAGYGRTGKYDEARSFFGVSTLMYFGNMSRLTMKDVTFVHTAGFSVQTGDAENLWFENITFSECFADGLHLNGNSKNIVTRNIHGQVGDDLVALNMYDWQNSSVNFGPTDCVLCENLELSADSRYKALRIEPGTYYYDEPFGEVDCALTNAVIRDVRGITTFKMYYQTPGYAIGTAPERGAVGSADWLYFEDISVDLDHPIDGFGQYQNSDPVRGAFGSFELGSNIGHIAFENIRLTLHRDRYPLTWLVVCGPKSICDGKYEVFDPYLSNEIGELTLKNITVNGQPAQSADDLVHVTSFDNVNNDSHSTGSGAIHKIIFEK